LKRSFNGAEPVFRVDRGFVPERISLSSAVAEWVSVSATAVVWKVETDCRSVAEWGWRDAIEWRSPIFRRFQDVRFGDLLIFNRLYGLRKNVEPLLLLSGKIRNFA
jgi:hypothetical protein